MSYLYSNSVNSSPLISRKIIGIYSFMLLLFGYVMGMAFIAAGYPFLFSLTVTVLIVAAIMAGPFIMLGGRV